MSETTGDYTLVGTTGDPISEEIASGSSVTLTITGDPDTFNITADDDATVAINQTTTSADTLNLVANGGTISISQSQPADTINVTIENDGELISNGYFGITSPAGSVTFGDGGGALVLGVAGTYKTATTPQLINNFTSDDDDIDEQSIKFKAVTGYTISTNATTGYQTITILATTGNYTFTSATSTFADGTYTTSSGPLDLFRDATGGTNISVTACFLDDVLIATPQGEVPVQQLAVGDLVSVREHGLTVSRPIIWVGSRTVRLAPTADRDAFPVRIRAGAFADGVPHRDLLVTAEHCIHVDGQLVPARMLVNGASIVVDDSITRFRFHHIELANHALLVSDGLETESYLDTGNRANFAGQIQALHPDLSAGPDSRSWSRDAAAPLAVDRATVEPISARLGARAAALGFRLPRPVALTGEHRLHLVVDGVELEPALHDGRFYAFVVPGDAAELRLVSRAARPSETVGPFLDDRRQLGVRIGRIGICRDGVRTETDRHLTADTLPGWHGVETGAGRWTNGNALLPLPAASATATPIYLDVELLDSGRYPAEAVQGDIELAA